MRVAHLLLVGGRCAVRRRAVVRVSPGALLVPQLVAESPDVIDSPPADLEDEDGAPGGRAGVA